MKTVKKIEDLPLWKTLSGMTIKVHDITNELPEEEKWSMQFNIQHSANDMTSYVAQAYGGIDPRDTKWALGKVRAALFAVKNGLKMCHKLYDIKLDPEMMLSIDASVEEIDKELEGLPKDIKEWNDEMTGGEKKS